MHHGPRHPDCTVELTGQDGNAFFILGTVRRELDRHLRAEGWSRQEIKEEVNAYLEEAMSSDYDALLATTMRWVNVE